MTKEKKNITIKIPVDTIKKVWEFIKKLLTKKVAKVGIGFLIITTILLGLSIKWDCGGSPSTWSCSGGYDTPSGGGADMIIKK